MYIKSLNRKYLAGFFGIMIALSSACAQNVDQHQQNQQFLTAKKSIESSTVLLSNPNQLIPVKNLDQQKMSSVF
jgi:hypothetical protein